MRTTIYHDILRMAKGWRGSLGVHKKTRITIETDQVLMVRQRYSTRTRCPQCGCEVDMVDLKEAGILSGMTQQTVCDFAEAQRWHCSEAHDGTVLICLESLLKSL